MNGFGSRTMVLPKENGLMENSAALEGCPYLSIWPVHTCSAKEAGIHVPADTTIDHLCTKQNHDECSMFQKMRPQVSEA